VKDLVEDVINPTGSPEPLNINTFLIGLFEKNLENLNPVSNFGFLRKLGAINQGVSRALNGI
jgi:hypothetical protein